MKCCIHTTLPVQLSIAKQRGPWSKCDTCMRYSFNLNRFFVRRSVGLLVFHILILLLQVGQTFKDAPATRFLISTCLRQRSADSFSLLNFFMQRSCDKFFKALPDDRREISHREGDTAFKCSVALGYWGRARIDLILTDITDIIRINDTQIKLFIVTILSFMHV